MSLLAPAPVSPELERTIPAVDASFKSEVLEYRIRAALQQQAQAEAAASGNALRDTDTGRQFGDFDWWLTEATLRSHHAGVDALAQVLNLVFALRLDPESLQLARDVAVQLRKREGCDDLTGALDSLRDECANLTAFVNYVKHAGFPQRQMQPSDGTDITARFIVVGRFRYKGKDYGPWPPAAVEGIIDGFRHQYIAVVIEAARALADG